MTKTKMTREEKKAAEAADRRHQRVADYRQRVERERALIVVESMHDVLTLGREGSPLAGREAELNVLYCAVSRFEYARKDYTAKLRWLRDNVADLDRYEAENRFAGSDASNAATRAVEVATAGATLRAAADAAADATRYAGVFLPALYDHRTIQARIARLDLVVEAALTAADVPAEWKLSRPSGAYLGGSAGESLSHYYDNEDDAWVAHAALCGSLSEVQ